MKTQTKRTLVNAVNSEADPRNETSPEKHVFQNIPADEAFDGVRQDNGEGITPPAEVHEVILPTVVLKNVTCKKDFFWGGERICYGSFDLSTSVTTSSHWYY